MIDSYKHNTINENEYAFTEFSYNICSYLNKSWINKQEKKLMKLMPNFHEIYNYGELCTSLKISKEINYQKNIDFSQLNRICCQVKEYHYFLHCCLFPKESGHDSSLKKILTEHEIWNQYNALSLKYRGSILGIEELERDQAVVNIIFLVFYDFPRPITQRIKLAFDKKKIIQSDIFLTDKINNLSKENLHILRRVFLRLINFIDKKWLESKKND